MSPVEGFDLFSYNYLMLTIKVTYNVKPKRT